MTIDAMGCQKAIAQQLVEAGADSVLALKDNPPSLCQDVSLWLDTEVAKGALPVWETVEKDHGRLETRRYHLSSDRTGWRKSLTWRVCRRWVASSPSASSVTKPRPNAATM